MYQDVLVPTDGSDASAAAVDHGVSIADRHDAVVHFLHVIDLGTEMSASGVGTVADELATTLESEAEDALDEACSRAENAGVDYERDTVEGIPHEAIVEYAAERDVDLVAMGVSGRSGLREHLLGSTTDRVVRSTNASVLVARE